MYVYIYTIHIGIYVDMHTHELMSTFQTTRRRNSTHLCVYMYTYIYTFTYVHMYICIYVYYTCMYIYRRIHI